MTDYREPTGSEYDIALVDDVDDEDVSKRDASKRAAARERRKLARTRDMRIAGLERRVLALEAAVASLVQSVSASSLHTWHPTETTKRWRCSKCRKYMTVYNVNEPDPAAFLPCLVLPLTDITPPT